MIKKGIGVLLTALMIFSGSSASFAGVWVTGTGTNENRWWYDNQDGTYAAGEWKWLDGNGDGTAECYYFDEEGWMAADTVTPDGYRVNGDGAWTENGQIMTRSVNSSKEGQEISITLQVNARSFSARLYDIEASRQLADQFPMTLEMRELNGNEKYHYLPGTFSVQEERVGTIHAGDIMLYGSSCLVLFYEDFDTSYQYTRLGQVENPQGLAEALGEGTAAVTFEIN